MKLKPWMIIAAGLAALLFLSRKKAQAAGTVNQNQDQNLFVDP